MRIRHLILLLSVQLASTAAPDFTRFAFTMKVKDKKETSHSGTGCLVKSGNAIYYVTAHHIFSDMADKQRSALVKMVSIVSETNSQIRFIPEEFIPVENVADLGKTDLMVFKMKNSPAMSAYAVTLLSLIHI